MKVKVWSVLSMLVPVAIWIWLAIFLPEMPGFHGGNVDDTVRVVIWAVTTLMINSVISGILLLKKNKP